MIEVVRGGLLTTVQDLGRAGFRALGVPAGGALDGVSLRVANLLVGNLEGAGALEVTLRGPSLRFQADGVVALAGAPGPLTLDGVPAPFCAPLTVRAGQLLQLGALQSGARAYLAVRGGLRAWDVLGSRATDLRGAFGGFEGRALRRGDALSVEASGARPAVPRLRVAPELVANAAPVTVLRALAGPEESDLDWTAHEWTVGPASDRMGLRLHGPLLRAPPAAGASEAVVPGVVQLPPNGQPIVLLADAGTHGGYARPLVVIRADLPRAGQLRPGDRMRFERVTFPEARAALARQEALLRTLRVAVQYAYVRAEQHQP